MTRSQLLFDEACRWIPGGVNSPARAFNAVGGDPFTVKRAEGPYLIDEDDNKYVDYVCTWGANILGHAHPAIVDGVTNAIYNGLGYGASTAIEIEMAKLITELMPAVEMVRMVNSGTEATMSAIRLARGVTGRDKIIKFKGCYHGHVDSLLVEAGSGALTHGHPSSPGVPADLVQHTLVANFNDLTSVEQLFASNKENIAAVIVEPVAGNMNCVPPASGFLQGLRQLCDDNQSLLILDEVMTGFRVALGGAQQKYDITPDIATFGKIIGGGLPVGGFGGRREIMSQLSPVGPIYQAGTLSGNHVAMTAGATALQLLIAAAPDFYKELEKNTQFLAEGLRDRAIANGFEAVTNYVPGMFGLYFTDQARVFDFDSVMRSDKALFAKFFKAMLAEGVYFAPSAYEACFISSAHTQQILENTLEIAERVFHKLSRSA